MIAQIAVELLCNIAGPSNAMFFIVSVMMEASRIVFLFVGNGPPDRGDDPLPEHLKPAVSSDRLFLPCG